MAILAFAYAQKEIRNYTPGVNAYAHVLHKIQGYQAPEGLVEGVNPVATSRFSIWSLKEALAPEDTLLIVNPDFAKAAEEIGSAPLLALLATDALVAGDGPKTHAMVWSHGKDGQSPSYVIEVRDTGLLKLRAVWISVKETQSRVIEIDRLVIEETTEFHPAAIGWTLTPQRLRTLDPAILKAYLESFFLERLNAAIRSSFLEDGSQDFLVKKKPLVVAAGTSEQLKDLLEAALACDAKDRSQELDDHGADITLISGTGIEYDEFNREPQLAAADGLRRARSFIEKHIIPHFKPTGFRWTANTSSNRTPKLRSSYDMEPLQIRVTAPAEITGHTVIAAAKKLTNWLVSIGKPFDQANAIVQGAFFGEAE